MDSTARNLRRKVYVEVDGETWWAYRVKCMQHGVTANVSLGSFVLAVSQGVAAPIAAQLELPATSPEKPPAKRRAPRSSSATKAPAKPPAKRRSRRSAS